MAIIKETLDYEKQFLERYLRGQAGKRIKELEERLVMTTDSFERLDIKRKIKVVTQALDDELKRMQEEEKEQTIVDVGSKKKEIGNFSETDIFNYRNVMIPNNVWNYLFDYQVSGVKWIIDLFKIGKGGVLADEMGLGKTIQVCTTIISLYNSNMADNFLVLSPTTVIDHWTKQFRQLEPCPAIYKQISLKKRGIFIMSYESFRESRLLPVFDIVILDEGHKIKNRESLISQAVMRIQAKSRFVVTGTPIQNNLSELWTIFNFVNPSLLGSYGTFQDEFEKRIKHGKTEAEIQTSYHYSVMLRSIIEPYILRRMKNSVEHILPNKIDRVVFVKLSELQIALYFEALKSKQFTSLLSDRSKSKTSLLSALTHLRKICNHPLLLENDIYAQDGSSYSDTMYLSDIKAEKLISESSKLQTTFEMLDRWYSENNRALIFFQTYKMLSIAKNAIMKLRREYSFLEMSGRTPSSRRSSLVDKFNNDTNVFLFLLTTRVGGIGLNLTGANRILIYDPDWNPSTDSQAKERIYRYGQVSDVEIYRLISKDTIEEKIYQKQIYKDRLSKKVLSNPSIEFDQEYILDLFDFHINFNQDTNIINYENHQIVNDELVSIKEEDKRDFAIFKESNARPFLSGNELVEYIKRRECNLNE